MILLAQFQDAANVEIFRRDLIYSLLEYCQ